MAEQNVPEKWKHLRPRTIEILRMRDFHDPREDPFGALAPPERGLTGPVYTSIAYTGSIDNLAEIFQGTRHGYAYPRISRGTPPIQALTEKLLDITLGENFSAKNAYDVLLTASGMSAIFLVALALADNGRAFISSPYLYGGTHHLFTERLPRLGIRCYMVEDPTCIYQWQKVMWQHPEATFLFAEDNANPTLLKLDNQKIAEIAHAHGKYYVCDNTIGTPILEKPLLKGTDFEINSLSKNPGGRSAGLGGSIVAKKELLRPIRDGAFPDIGPVMDARVADYMLAGLNDFRERVMLKVTNARFLANFLRLHPRVARVCGPGGDLLAFEIKGTTQDARRVAEAFQLAVLAPHLGDIRTLVILPGLTTHSSLSPEERARFGISETFMRVSVGLEDPEDIIDDFCHALAA